MKSIAKTNLNGKKIVLGITGSIAVYKACEIVRLLMKQNAEVIVVMTKSAKEFVAPLTFKTLTGNTVITDMFNAEAPVPHIRLGEWADFVIVAPSTANIVGKMASGIADDILSTFLMSVKAPVLVAPAMNLNMLSNPAYIRNVKTLKQDGVCFIDAEEGYLACGYEGAGRLASPEKIIDEASNIIRGLVKQK